MSRQDGVLTPGAQRRCGACSLCCKIMGVPDVTERDVWCQHAAPGIKHGDGRERPAGGGCKIYHTRPEPCRAFHCVWLTDDKFKDYWFPAKCKIMIDVKIEPQRVVCFHVDPDYPNRWREDPWFSEIRHIAKAGLDGRKGQTWTTVVMVRDERITIVP